MGPYICPDIKDEGHTTEITSEAYKKYEANKIRQSNKTMVSQNQKNGQELKKPGLLFLTGCPVKLSALQKSDAVATQT